MTIKIDVGEALEQHDKSLAAIDENQNCSTCKYHNKEVNPCDECYDKMLWFHVNPTKWEQKQ